MTRHRHFFHKTLMTALIVILCGISASCSGSSKKANGDLKRTPYCDAYREFDDKVAKAKDKEQLQLLTKIRNAKSFPAEMKKDYDLVISSYKKVLAGKDVSNIEQKNQAAIARMTRNAMTRCDLLKSNQSGGGI